MLILSVLRLRNGVVVSLHSEASPHSLSHFSHCTNEFLKHFFPSQNVYFLSRHCLNVIQSEKKSLTYVLQLPAPLPIQMTCFLASGWCLYVVVCMLKIILFGSLVLTLLLLL